MNRDILFRGKRADNSKWATSVCPFGVMRFGTITANFIPDTVGQYTGLTDKNGTKIFEGDIVHVDDILHKACGIFHEFDGYVDFAKGSFRIVGTIIANYRWTDYEVEVIGNVHDNPDLLEGAQHV